MRISVRQFIHDKLYLKDGVYTLMNYGKASKTITVDSCVDTPTVDTKKTVYTKPSTPTVNTPVVTSNDSVRQEPAPYQIKPPNTSLSDLEHYACGCKRTSYPGCTKHG